MTDETAKAILDLPDDAIIGVSVPTYSTFPQYEGHLQPLDVKIDRADLQRMAKLWLMRDDLGDAVREVLSDEQNRPYVKDSRVRYYQDLLTKLAALEDK